MIRKNQAFLNRLNVLLDMLIVIAAYVLSSLFYLEVLDGYSGNMAAVSGRNILLSFVYALVVFFILSSFGFYKTTRIRRLIWKIRVIFFSVSIAVLLASTVLFLFKLIDFSRGVLIFFYLFTLLLLTGKYCIMRATFNRMREKGYNLKHIVVIGTGELAEEFAEEAQKERNLGIRIEGFAGPEPDRTEQWLGDYDQLDRILSRKDLQEAVIALEPEEYRRIREMIAVCEKNGIKYYVLPFYNNSIPANPVIEPVGRCKLIDMRANRLDDMGWGLIKRGFDILASLAGLLALSPLLLLIALGVKLSSPGPVLFRQTRVGYGRKEFQMLKFRSMKVNREQDTAWSKDRDDRRTPFGSLIRKTSLDELPQLWNVLRGDMSLVGPRPELPHFVEQFKEKIPLYMVKHQVKPGITGWAQVNGYRGDTSIEKRIELDIWYIENWSIGLDLRILFMTLFGGMVNREQLKQENRPAEQQKNGH